MRIASIIDISLVDVPGIPVSVIFTGGCNFDCPFCQNADLIPTGSGEEMEISDIVVSVRSNLVDGYCITGGEPTIYKDLPDLLRALKEDNGRHINLNTQGSVPDVLLQCIPYLDSVWFDIKASAENYQEITGTKTNPLSRVIESIKMLVSSDVEFWPRTTYVGGLMTPHDIRGVLRLLEQLGFQGTYLVQDYVDSKGVREEFARAFKKPSKEELMPLMDSLPEGITMRLEWR